MGIFNLHGRVAVVTGGTAGLGRGMAIALARQGADLAILARRPDKLTETAREIESLGGRCLPVVCDISDEASVQNAVETVVAEAPGDKGRDGGCGKYNREVLEGQKLPVHHHVQYHKKRKGRDNDDDGQRLDPALVPGSG